MLTRRSLIASLAGSIPTLAVAPAALGYTPHNVIDTHEQNDNTLELALARIGPENLMALLEEGMVLDGFKYSYPLPRVLFTTATAVRIAYARSTTNFTDLRAALNLNYLHDALHDTRLKPHLIDRIRYTLSTIPGYEEEAGRHQSQTARDQTLYTYLAAERLLNRLEKGGDAIAGDVLKGYVDWRDLEKAEQNA